MRDAASSPAAAGRDAVLYARVSSKDQEKGGLSIPAQRKLLRRYALDHGLAVVDEFTDVETAGRAGRARFGEMVRFLKGHRTCRVVLVEKTDRLYRNLEDWIALDELGLEVHLVEEGVVLRVAPAVGIEPTTNGLTVLWPKPRSPSETRGCAPTRHRTSSPVPQTSGLVAPTAARTRLHVP